MQVINDGYYDSATHTWRSPFWHASRFRAGEELSKSLARHMHYLAMQLQLRPGMRVLDVGCFTGQAVREIALISDAHVVGVNNNESQVEYARWITKLARLEERVEFVIGDVMNLVELFGENSFDVVYAIESTCHAPSLGGIYDQIKKVLKPGGVFGVYEWCMTDAWDPSTPEHRELARRLAIANCIPEMRTFKDFHQAFINAGFKIEREEDLAERPDPLPWYYSLVGNFRDVHSLWDLQGVWLRSSIGKFMMDFSWRVLEKAGVASKEMLEVRVIMDVARDALLEGGQTKLFTPMFLVIARKASCRFLQL